jgi:hypothetical protein
VIKAGFLVLFGCNWGEVLIRRNPDFNGEPVFGDLKNFIDLLTEN